MAGESKPATDREVIRKWVEARGDRPATFKGTSTKEEPGVLGINFPGVGAGESP